MSQAGNSVCRPPKIPDQKPDRIAGSRQSGLPCNEGFSLLELVIAIVVMGLAVAVTYPALSRGTASLHLKATGRDIMNAMRHAREKAITEQRNMKVQADRETQQVVLTDEFGGGGRTYTLPADVTMQRVTLGGKEITDGPLVIRFLPNGSAENAEILLQSKTGAFLRVATDPITGGARVFPGLEGVAR